MKLHVIFNTCGIARAGNVEHYKNRIRSILNQGGVDFRVCVSSCRNSEGDRVDMMNAFKGHPVSFNFTEDTLPVNITFNDSCRFMAIEYGMPDAFVYMDSGVTLPNSGCLQHLLKLHQFGPYAMTAARTTTDAGTYLWFQKGNHHGDESGQQGLYEKGDLVVPIGKTVNLHLQLFDKAIFNSFRGSILPDVFASYCTESVFTFVCAALGMQFVSSATVVVDHTVALDWGSAGFRPEGLGHPYWQHLLPFAPRKMAEIVADPEALACGFGYEECQNILNHDPNCYTEHGFCQDPQRLLNFIKANLYLDRNHFSYDQIRHNFIP